MFERLPDQPPSAPSERLPADSTDEVGPEIGAPTGATVAPLDRLLCEGTSVGRDAPRHLVVVTEGALTDWDDKTTVLSPVSRRRVAAAGSYYQRHAAAIGQGGSILFGDVPRRSGNWRQSAAAAVKYFRNMYGLPQCPIVAADCTTPFGLFEEAARRGLYDGAVFDDAAPLVIAGGRSFGSRVMAPIARQLFAIDDRRGVTVLAAEHVAPGRVLRDRLASAAVRAVLDSGEITASDPDSLARAGRDYEIAYAGLRALVSPALRRYL